MAKSYKPTEYMYSSARLRSLEAKILGREDVYRFADADGAENILPALADHGFELVRNSLGEILREDTLMSALEKGFADDCDITPDEAMALYDIKAKETLELMKKKNHDYNEAWRGMRVTSYTDLILTKIWRTKQIEELGGATKVSEGVDANYMDMINYAVFALIKNGVAEQE